MPNPQRACQLCCNGRTESKKTKMRKKEHNIKDREREREILNSCQEPSKPSFTVPPTETTESCVVHYCVGLFPILLDNVSLLCCCIVLFYCIMRAVLFSTVLMLHCAVLLLLNLYKLTQLKWKLKLKWNVALNKLKIK